MAAPAAPARRRGRRPPRRSRCGGRGTGGFVELLDDYAAAAEPVARADLDYVGRRVAREDLVESVVVGTVLGEAMFSALRRLAHVDASARAYGDGGPGESRGAG